jgi:hypothetical protein
MDEGDIEVTVKIGCWTGLRLIKAGALPPMIPPLTDEAAAKLVAQEAESLTRVLLRRIGEPG